MNIYTNTCPRPITLLVGDTLKTIMVGEEVKTRLTLDCECLTLKIRKPRVKRSKEEDDDGNSKT